MNKPSHESSQESLLTPSISVPVSSEFVQRQFILKVTWPHQRGDSWFLYGSWYKYSRTPVTLPLKGNEKQFASAESSSYWGKCQWNIDQGKGNLVVVSEKFELSEFELSRFHYITNEFYKPYLPVQYWERNLISFSTSMSHQFLTEYFFISCSVSFFVCPGTGSWNR